MASGDENILSNLVILFIFICYNWNLKLRLLTLLTLIGSFGGTSKLSLDVNLS